MRRSARAILLVAASLTACNPVTLTPGPDGGIRPDATGTEVRCSTADDPDVDVISSMDEGSDDPDHDSIPNDHDPDSDGDGIRDIDEAGDASCTTRPADTDRDGTPDFLDRDSNADGVDDAEQTSDTDGDGTPDWREDDIDGDGIDNATELGDGPTARDTDGDGTPDVRDLDSDADTVPDRLEGVTDTDGDHVPSYRDLDTDGDGIEDTIEAGDADLDTPPLGCSAEIDPATGEIRSDGLANFQDADSDNDGFGDGEEIAIGTNPCNIDSDNDGTGDLAEGAYERFNCPEGSDPDTNETCGCATSAGCGIPDRHFYVVLPYNDPEIERDLEFSTAIRVADVFFLTDTTGSMMGTLNNVQNAVTSSGGLIDRITATIPDAWVGGGQYDDYPFGNPRGIPYGSPPDEMFRLAIRMTPPDRSAEVRTAFDAIGIHNGSDGPESGTEALYQLMAGGGTTWMGLGGATYSMPSYSGLCLDGGWGAACFREAALPIVILFTDICSHNGPTEGVAACEPGQEYASITPAPALFADAMREMNLRGAKFVGVNANGSFDCSTEGPSPVGSSPCYFLRRTAEETGSVDTDGNALVYDLPNSGTDISVFTDTIAHAIDTVATRVPLDVDTALRDDPTDPAPGVDARRFIVRRQPACQALGNDECWQEPTGVTHAEAVAAYDTSTFFGVVPGTRVTFRITFRNTFVPGGLTAQLFVAFIDVRGGGAAVLDTRQVFVVVPAASGGPIG